MALSGNTGVMGSGTELGRGEGEKSGLDMAELQTISALRTSFAQPLASFSE